MRIPAWGPEYQIQELGIGKGKKGRINLTLGDEKYSFRPKEIGISILGTVEAFNSNPQFADYATVEPIYQGTLELLDALAELEVPNLYIVKYANIDKGQDLVGDLKEYEEGAKVYLSKCTNPTIDTEIIKDLKDVKALFVTGLQGHTNIMQFVNALKSQKESGRIGLEQLFLPDSCVGIVNKLENYDELNFWSKNYMSTNSDAKIVDVYRGETKIT
ncbi:MAG: hypothetical protein JSW73_00585 [Candidatus Woesearchaeota archaeon]|nr:MAG: hypothetical protein JSW73_00585 [Candidatus Woesearchaeota archaeon]